MLKFKYYPPKKIVYEKELCMKKPIFIIFSIILVSLLVACGGSSGGASTSDFLKVMEDEGYVFTQRDEDGREYYQANSVNAAYDLDLDVTDLYVGYINSSERWAEVVVFKTSAQAESYRNELVQDENKVGLIVVIDENVVLLTYSSETASLYNDSKSS